MKEEWLPIKEYEHLYMVSNIGRIKSLSRPVRRRHGVFMSKDKILNPYVSTSRGYASIGLYKNNKIKRVEIHRLVYNAFIGIGNAHHIDHINRIRTDNRLVNLRPATATQSAANSRKRKSCSSKYKGVSQDKRTGKWIAYIFNYKKYHLGVFINENDAARAYNKKALELFGEYAFINNVLEQASVTRPDLLRYI